MLEICHAVINSPRNAHQSRLSITTWNRSKAFIKYSLIILRGRDRSFHLRRRSRLFKSTKFKHIAIVPLGQGQHTDDRSIPVLTIPLYSRYNKSVDNFHPEDYKNELFERIIFASNDYKDIL
jgi:hypothetical protein